VIKIIAMFARKRDWSRSEFYAHYQERHAPLAAGSKNFTKHCIKYVQNYAILRDDGLAVRGHRTDRDAISEMWFRDIDGMNGTYSNECYLRVIRPDELRLADIQSASSFVCEEYEIEPSIPSPDLDKRWSREPRVKLFVFRVPKAGKQADEFQREWRNVASTICLQAEFRTFVRRYTQAHVLDVSPADLATPDNDGNRCALVDQFYFENAYDALRFYQGIEANKEIRGLEDRHTNVDAVDLFFSKSHLVWIDEGI
jgi:hypothetical protein